MREQSFCLFSSDEMDLQSLDLPFRLCRLKSYALWHHGESQFHLIAFHVQTLSQSHVLVCRKLWQDRTETVHLEWPVYVFLLG